jgi:hypothetical protein
MILQDVTPNVRNYPLNKNEATHECARQQCDFHRSPREILMSQSLHGRVSECIILFIEWLRRNFVSFWIESNDHARIYWGISAFCICKWCIPR